MRYTAGRDEETDPIAGKAEEEVIEFSVLMQVVLYAQLCFRSAVI